MDQEQEDRRPTDSDVPTKKQRLNRPRLSPLQNPYNIMNWLPANQVNQRMVDFEQQQNGIDEQQQVGRLSSCSCSIYIIDLYFNI